MSDLAETNDKARKEAPTPLDNFLEHVQDALKSVSTLRWDEVKFHLDSMDASAAAADPSEKPYIEALHEPIRGFALGFQQFTTAKTEADQKKALDYLSGARNALRKVKAEQPKLTDNPGFAQLAFGIEGQILGVQERMARSRGDASEVAILNSQRAQLLRDMIDPLGPDDPLRHFLEASRLLEVALPSFSTGLKYLMEMNLDLAQTYLEESSKSVVEMREHFSKAKGDDLNAVIFETGRNTAEGLGLLVSGQDAYVRVLRAAIIGDVNKGDVEALRTAERAFVDGAALLSKSVLMMPGIFGGVDLGPIVLTQAKLTNNLRTLCERSLSPKVITVTTAPKVVFYFVGTFIVLLIGLPTSGLVARLQTSDLGLLLIVSLFVSVIGAFGFEATRLVPLFNVFPSLLPWGRSKESAAKAE
jgi:hypothetical protein